MAQTRCPHCLRTLEVPDCLAFGLIRCSGCQETYTYQPGEVPQPSEPASAEQLAAILAEPPRTEPARSPTPAPTLMSTPEPESTGPALVAPHICQHCWRQITFTIGKKAAAPNCPGCKNKTSVYAIQFRCPSCSHLLESPRRLNGQVRPCPKCERDVTIPRLVLEEESEAADDLESFLCECPSCRKRIVARRDEVGRPGVCPLCLVIIDVPAYGTASRPRETTRTERDIACRECGRHIPAAAEHCPVCGKDNRPSQYP